MSNEIDDLTYNRITLLSEEGNEHSDQGQYDEAIASYQQALSMIPGQKRDWEATTWILISLGDCFFLMDKFDLSYSYLIEALHCPNGIGNPFLHLRLGQVQFELGNFERSQDELTRAYMGGGIDIFNEEDKKYIDFLKTKIKFP